MNNLIQFPRFIFENFEDRISNIIETAEKIKKLPEENISANLLQIQLYNLATAVEHLFFEIKEHKYEKD